MSHLNILSTNVLNFAKYTKKDIKLENAVKNDDVSTAQTIENTFSSNLFHPYVSR